MANLLKPKCGAPCAKGIPPVSSISNGGIGAGNTGVGGGCNPIPRPTATTPIINDVPDAAKNYGLYKIKVLEISFFPVAGGKLDIAQTGDVSESLDFMRVKVRNMTKKAIEKLEQGSCYRKYSNPNSTPICSYQVVGRIEIQEPYPQRRGCEWQSQGFNPPLVDYEEILNRVNGKDWVNQQGVTQFWVYGYHGEKVTLWESNMSSAYGNVSNSGRLAKELPIYNRTYTIYNYNYSREVDTILEDHTHQMEALLNHIDKRADTPENEWNKLLFWGLFVGSDKSHRPKQINGRYRCGWTHYPPNGVEDYDWQNRNRVASDMFDWTPQGVGQARMVSAQDWNLNDDGGVEWKVKWLQSVPGPNNGLNHNGRPLTNWWIFYGDFDGAMGSRLKLTD